MAASRRAASLELAEGGVLELAEGGVLELAEGGVLELAEGGVLELAEGGVLELAEGGVSELAEGQDEMSYALAKGLTIGRPYGLSACVIGRDPGCPSVPPFDSLYHRVELRFNASTVGDLIAYQAQRKRAGATDNTYATVGTSPTNRLIDPTELADGVQYQYRVRAQTAEGNSPWSRSTVIRASNNTPVAAANAYATTNKETLTVAGPGRACQRCGRRQPDGVHGAQSPALERPSQGTLILNANGSFTYKSKRWRRRRRQLHLRGRRRLVERQSHGSVEWTVTACDGDDHRDQEISPLYPTLSPEVGERAGMGARPT